MKEVSTNDLRLHTWTLDLLQKTIENPQRMATDLRLKVADGWPNNDERQDFLPLLVRTLQKSPDTARWFGGMVIHKADTRIIGCAGFMGPPDENGNIEIGYGIAPAYQGRGFATQISQALIQWAFEMPQVKAVTAGCVGDNERSKRVLEKLGMKQIVVQEGLNYWILLNRELR